MFFFSFKVSRASAAPVQAREIVDTSGRDNTGFSGCFIKIAFSSHLENEHIQITI